MSIWSIYACLKQMGGFSGGEKARERRKLDSGKKHIAPCASVRVQHTQGKIDKLYRVLHTTLKHAIHTQTKSVDYPKGIRGAASAASNHSPVLCLDYATS